MVFEITSARSRLLVRMLPIISLSLFFLTWECMVAGPGDEDTWRVPATLLAKPSTVFALAVEKIHEVAPDGATILQHTWISMQEAVLGYVLALSIGLPLGLMMGWFSVVRGLMLPIFEIIRPIPSIAWIPLTIFWFGIGLTGKVFIIWLAGLVPCVINSFVGVRMSNPTLIQMARTYGASDWQIFRTICVPSALPMVFGALQISLSACWITLVAAELLASDQGLGFLISMGRSLGRTDLVLLGMCSIAVMGIIIGYIIDKVEARLLAGIRR